MSPRSPAHDVVVLQDRQGGPRPGAVTVAVSLYHYARFVEACLDSVLGQTHPHVELIVVDDHSTEDASLDTARAWCERHGDRLDRCSLLRHRHNRGLAAARNTAFAEARTEHVFVLDADNMIYPRALARLHEAARDAGADAAYSQLELFGDQQQIGQADVWSRRRFQRGNYVDAMALIRSRSWREVGGYSHIEGGWEDFDLWCKFIEAGMVGLYVPEILCRYRVHGSSMLRTDTVTATDALKVELSARHPWLTF
jgi:glycosyltransferase involved in cell wall biosynthesis